MRHRYILIPLMLLAAAGAQAQADGIGRILQQIESNNKELQADAHRLSAQKAENRAGNNLPDPTLSYAHLWDSKNSSETVGELIVSQSFDFPTLYATRSRMNRQMNAALDAQAAGRRQQLLLEAQQLCLDIICLHQQQQLLDERLKNAEELAALYARRLESEDASILETNKIELELLNVHTETRLNEATLENKLKALTALNGNQPLMPGRPLADAPLPRPAALGLTEYADIPLPADFQPLCDELLAATPALQALQSERDAALRRLSASRQGWLPKLELGYRRNTESGHPLNGVVVGFSFPLFENRGKVKGAKSQAAALDYHQQDARLQASSALWQLYGEASRLQASIQEYRQTFSRQQSLDLLKQALTGGQLSLIEYFVEVSVIYQSKSNLLQLENRYQQVMAELYKSRL